MSITAQEQEKANKILNSMMEDAEKPLIFLRHYEIEMSDEKEAEEKAYEVNDGWGPFVNAEAHGKVLCFGTNDLVAVMNKPKDKKTLTDYAGQLNESWFGGKGTLLTCMEGRQKYATEWNAYVAKKASAA